MQYMILCYDSERTIGAWTKEKDDQVMASLGAVLDRLDAQRQLVSTGRLMNTKTAATIRKGKDSMVVDGPFAETKEQLLGFYLVDCATKEAALEIAQELAHASGSEGAFELRPLLYFRAGSDAP